MFCIQNYIYKNRVRTCEFLEKFDSLQVGSITKNQFERGLSNMGVGKYLSRRELDLLANRYLDPLDTNRVRWRNFVDEIDTGKEILTSMHLSIAKIYSSLSFHHQKSGQDAAMRG